MRKQYGIFYIENALSGGKFYAPITAWRSYDC